MIELLIISFILSVFLNSILIWFLRENTKRLIFISRNIGHLIDIVLEYKDHLKSISELELFYGDDNIINLIKHTKFMVGEIDKFKEIYSLAEEEELYLQDDRDEEGEEEETKKEE